VAASDSVSVDEATLVVVPPGESHVEVRFWARTHQVPLTDREREVALLADQRGQIGDRAAELAGEHVSD
jgi:hypothetical protein